MPVVSVFIPSLAACLHVQGVMDHAFRGGDGGNGGDVAMTAAATYSAMAAPGGNSNEATSPHHRSGAVMGLFPPCDL